MKAQNHLEQSGSNSFMYISSTKDDNGQEIAMDTQIRPDQLEH
jgi:hypothetical protein